MFAMRTVLPAAVVCLSAAAMLRADDWTHYGGDTARTGIATRAARDLDSVRWFATPGSDEEYVWRSAPVVHGGRVFVNARLYADNVQVGNLVTAYDITDGAHLWSQPIEMDVYDSWSSPAVDARHQTVLVASGYSVYALDTVTGTPQWVTPLEGPVVNASPVVTTDLLSNGTPANRVFITDYNGYGGDARLYAINVDPPALPDNPHQLGEIAWTATLPGASGNSPAYENGVVYVASVGGIIKALDAGTGALVWETEADFSEYPQYTGFYGGVTVRNGFVYAASYCFYGSGNNSGLFKLDAIDGDIVWVAPCERTESIPIVTDDGRIYLSAGLAGYGSCIKIQAFQDYGDTVTALWDTYVDTDGELIVGGWTYEPAYARGYLYAGAPPDGDFEFFLPYTDLYILDTLRAPGDSDFIVAHHGGAGGSPAIADGTVYSIGEAGLLVFDPSPACLADLDGDGIVGLADLATLLAAYGSARGDQTFDSDADLDRDGAVDLSDLAGLLSVYGGVCR
jgi:outer membrane protein assembly factor BamB